MKSRLSAPYLYARLQGLLAAETACVAEEDVDALAVTISEQLEDVEKCLLHLQDCARALENSLLSQEPATAADLRQRKAVAERGINAFNDLQVDAVVCSNTWYRPIVNRGHEIILDVPSKEDGVGYAISSKHGLGSHVDYFVWRINGYGEAEAEAVPYIEDGFVFLTDVLSELQEAVHRSDEE